jgi:hypothetical protein
MNPTFEWFDVADLRCPTSRPLDGSDAHVPTSRLRTSERAAAWPL